MHLRMTGNLLIAGSERFGAPRLYESEPDARFLRAVLELDDGSELVHGRAALRPCRGLERGGAGAVPGPAGDRAAGRRADGETLAQLAAGRTAPLVSSTSAGWRASGTSTRTRRLARRAASALARRVDAREREALVEGIVEALEAGLANGGSSIDDYRDAGERGSMQDEFLVHTREGQDCLLVAVRSGASSSRAARLTARTARSGCAPPAPKAAGRR